MLPPAISARHGVVFMRISIPLSDSSKSRRQCFLNQDEKQNIIKYLGVDGGISCVQNEKKLLLKKRAVFGRTGVGQLRGKFYFFFLSVLVSGFVLPHEKVEFRNNGRTRREKERQAECERRQGPRCKHRRVGRDYCSVIGTEEIVDGSDLGFEKVFLGECCSTPRAPELATCSTSRLATQESASSLTPMYSGSPPHRPSNVCCCCCCLYCMECNPMRIKYLKYIVLFEVLHIH